MAMFTPEHAHHWVLQRSSWAEHCRVHVARTALPPLDPLSALLLSEIPNQCVCICGSHYVHNWVPRDRSRGCLVCQCLSTPSWSRLRSAIVALIPDRPLGSCPIVARGKRPLMALLVVCMFRCQSRFHSPFGIFVPRMTLQQAPRNEAEGRWKLGGEVVCFRKAPAVSLLLPP